MIHDVLTEPPPPLGPHIPKGLKAICLKCLEKARERRFASAKELAEALAGVVKAPLQKPEETKELNTESPSQETIPLSPRKPGDSADSL